MTATATGLAPAVEIENARGTAGNGPQPATFTTSTIPMTKVGTPIPTVDSTVTTTSHTE